MRYANTSHPLVGGSNPSAATRVFPTVTVAIIALNAAMFAMELARGDSIVLAYGLIPSDIVAGRNWATLLTAIFLHGGPLHIIGNTVFLWIFGPTLENEIGHLKFAALYLAGGMCGWLAEIAAEPTSTVANLGASGAIAAVMGAYLITWRREGARRVSFFGWSFPIGLIPALVLIALFSAGLVTDQTEDVAYMSHAGGLAFGAVVGSQFR